jgi:hypothetical protein
MKVKVPVTLNAPKVCPGVPMLLNSVLLISFTTQNFGILSCREAAFFKPDNEQPIDNAERNK